MIWRRTAADQTAAPPDASAAPAAGGGAAAAQQQQQQPRSSCSPQQQPALAAICPVVGAAPPRGASAAGCPALAGGGGGAVNPANLMPPSANAPLPGQSKPLSTWRRTSSIPTAAPPGSDAAAAPHQPAASPAWVYPSEQQFFNAMRRKGWSPAEDDMPAVVAIHNAVNERAWAEVRRWEAALHGAEAAACGGPRLARFAGRPGSPSPKARLLRALGFAAPFDRHDWVVDRCGREVRYVVDFYGGPPAPGLPPAVHLDVRPALDSPGAAWDRLRMQWRWVASGRWATG